MMALTFKCDDCRKSLYKIPWAPMLRDEVWKKIGGEPRTLLCGNCMLKRAAYRKVEICLADLRPCLMNIRTASALTDWSWFERLRKGPLSPKLAEEWRDVVMEGGHGPLDAVSNLRRELGERPRAVSDLLALVGLSVDTLERGREDWVRRLHGEGRA